MCYKQQNIMDNAIVFVFRRDFRVYDNTTFIDTIKIANENGWKIIPVFIFNPDQINKTKNEYYSSNCVQFMVQSLLDLGEQLVNEGGKLYYFHGKDTDILNNIGKVFTIKAVASNKDITPFALKRDEVIRVWCDKKGVPFVNDEDYTMYPIEQVRTNLGKPYEIYTPFYRRAIRIPVPEPHDIPEMNRGVSFAKKDIPTEQSSADMDKYYTFNEFIEIKGGRKEALDILEKVRTGGFRKYKKDNDYPIKDATTRLSAHLKFGTVSIREAFKVVKEALGKESALVSQLYWREFYYNVAYHYPEILKGQVGEKSTPIHGRYEKAE